MKRQQLDQRLAQILLEGRPGEQLPTVRELANRLGVSVGSVQAALTEFDKRGAIEIEKRGWQGAFLKKRNLGQLWNSAENGDPLVIAFPLPSTRICEGLATGIKALLTDAGIDAFMIFLRGSRHRLRALRNRRCHVAVMSSFSAQKMCSPEETSVLELPPQTYVKEHLVYYVSRPFGTQNDPLRVVIDQDSADLQRLTEMEFENTPVEFVPAIFLQYAHLLEQGEVDAAIWDVDEANVRFTSSVQSRSLSDRVRKLIGDSNTRANLVARIEDRTVAVVIKQCLDNPSLLSIQDDVFNGRRVPSY